jgi:mRNA-degrading endonuclease RelE of RelBE toxin-antitoxin system
MNYSVVIPKPVQKQLENLPKTERDKIIPVLKLFATPTFATHLRTWPTEQVSLSINKSEPNQCHWVKLKT